MLPDLAAGAAVRVLNRLLERETSAREQLMLYAGRTAKFEVPPFSILLGIESDGRFRVAGGTPDVSITVDPTQVPAALFDPSALLRNVRLAGDADFAQTLSTVLQRLRPEPEEELARFVGDAAAVRIVGLLRAAAATAADGAARLARSACDYLVAENPMLVTRSEADAFTRDVSTLRDAVERLEKRMDLLPARPR
jgi:ubiquinone biosynthesis accessory factor UbiJ